MSRELPATMKTGARGVVRLGLLLAAGWWAAACAPARVPLPAGAETAPEAPVARSLAQTVDALAPCRSNLCRLAAVRRRARELGLSGAVSTEWIDWFSLQRNVLVELAGGADAEIVYVVAHYDKTDINPLKFASMLVNDLLDPLAAFTYLSQGATDNASGVAVALQLAAALARRELRRNYRVLLTGAEEGGLRGARAHVARLSAAERDRIAFAVNLDTVGLADRPNCLLENVGDPELREAAREAARRAGFALGGWPLPPLALGDFAPFERHGFLRDLVLGLTANLTGGLLPQRSWFARPWRGRVVAFSSCGLLGAGDWLSGVVLLPLGRIHGPRDTARRVDPERLYRQYAIVLELLTGLDAGR